MDNTEALETELAQTTFAPIEEVLTERGQTHGKFSDHAKYTQQFKTILLGAYAERHRRGQEPLTAQQRESLEMIAHKVGRILAGDPTFADHWFDIEGYARIANKEF